jgi:hypothetical protein
MDRLGDSLGILDPDRNVLWADDETTALMIRAHQKVVGGPGVDMGTYTSARIRDLEYLRAIAGAPTPRLTGLLPAPVSEMIRDATAEFDKIKDVVMFNLDMPGVHERLAEAEQMEFIDRIHRDGDLAAMLWVYERRPEIFRTADFPPFTVPQESWRQFITNVAKRAE